MGSTIMRSVIAAACVASAIVLASCGSDPEPESAPTPTAPVEKPKSLQERDPQAYHDNIGSAMAEVPEAYRADLGKAIGCVLSTPGPDGRRAVLSSSLVRDLTEKLKSGQSADAMCQTSQGASQ